MIRPRDPETTTPPVDRVQIALLGSPTVVWADQPLTIPRRQVRALLFRLAAANQALPRDQLSFLLWPDSEQTTARRNLSVLIAQLRRALPRPDALVLRDDTLALNPAAATVDTATFHALAPPALRAIQPESLAEAAQLYRAPFLDGFVLPDAVEFEAWVDQERHSWQRRYLATLATLVEGYAERGAYAEAIAAAQQALATDPLAEELYRRLIALYASVGDRAAALREYRRCATVFERELGVEPLPETVALYEAVRDGRIAAPGEITAAPPVLSQPGSQPPPLASPATRAPVPLDTLFGRADELAALHGLLDDPAVRLITLTGPGGSGKTRLALELVRRVAPLFPDGVTFVPLAPLRDPALLLDAVAQAYGVIGAGAPSIAAALQRALQGRRCLLVLDNLEQLLPAAPALADLLGTLPELRLLVTSRTLLRLSGEQQFPVPPLPLPDLAALPPPDELARQPAVALLLARTQALSPQFALTPSNAAEIAALCVRLDGLPLALELAAARLRLMSAQALLRRLERPLALLSEGTRNLPERQRGLRALIAWSDGLLDSGPRTLLASLAVCAGSWTLDVAETLGRAAGHPALRSPEGVLDALAALVDASLVLQRVGADGEPRFALLETVRAYALERLEERRAVATLADAHAQVYAARAAAAAIPLHTADAPRWLDEVEADYPNLLVALDTATGHHDPERALALLELLIPYWYTRGLLHEGHYWLERALLPRIAPVAQPAAGEAMQERPDAQRLARVCFLASNLYFLQGEYDKALPYLEVCIAGWRAGGNASWLSVALLTLAGAYALSGDAGRGAAALDEGLALVASADDPEVQAWRAHVQGRERRHRGQPRAARDALRAAAAYYRQRGDRWRLAAVLLDLTPVLLALGDEAAAAATAAEALEAARAFKSHALVAAALNELGEIARYRGELAEAEAYYTESVGLLRRIGNRADEPRLQHNLAQLALSKGELAVAAAGFAASLADFVERRIERGVMEALVGLGAVATALGATLDAARLWGAAAALGAVEQWELWPPDQLAYARAVAQARATSDSAAFEAAWQAGRALSPAEASSLAQDVERRATNVPHQPEQARRWRTGVG